MTQLRFFTDGACVDIVVPNDCKNVYVPLGFTKSCFAFVLLNYKLASQLFYSHVVLLISLTDNCLINALTNNQVTD